MTKLPVFSSLIKQFTTGVDIPHELKAANDTAELVFIPALESSDDPEYWFLTQGTKVVLGYTGLVKSVHRYTRNGKHLDVDTELFRANAYGNYQPNDQAFIDETLNTVYDQISQLEFKSEELSLMFDWRGQRVLARFGDFKQLYSETDIIPEYNDHMTIVKISEGCPRFCIYCPEPNSRGITLFDEEQIRNNMEFARQLQLKYHDGFTGRMDEGFLNTSDILWFHLLNGMDPTEIVDQFNNYFPELRKRGTFMGVPTVNKVSKKYLAELFHDAKRINRVLVGIESGHEPTSVFLGKNETAEQKSLAINKLNDIGYKVKIIVQVGNVGNGFFDNKNNFVSSREGLEATVDFLSSVYLQGSNTKILISKYIPIPDTPLFDYHLDPVGRIVPYSSPQELDDEVEWFKNSLVKNGIGYGQIETDYEHALENRIRNSK